MSADTINAVSFRRHHEDFEGFAQDLGSSFARYGFAVISDHELDQAQIEAALAPEGGRDFGHAAQLEGYLALL